MSDRPSGNPDYAANELRGLPVVSSPASEPHVADRDHLQRVEASRSAPASSGWSPTAWRTGAFRPGSE